MEYRYPNPGKSSELPHDFLKMVTEVFTTNFDAGLKALGKLRPKPQFEAQGKIYPKEIVLCVAITHPKQLSATTVYASVDFDPKASSPTIQDLLSLCVDAVGTIYHQLLASGKSGIEQLADETTAALRDVPLEWTALEVEKRKIYVMVDKSNPSLDQAADEWLLKNDPEALEKLAEEAEATSNLFVTGPKKQGGGSTH